MRKIILFIFAMVAINATTPTYENVTKLYVATFDRTPDVVGLKYWVNDSGLELEGIARSFFDQPETKAKYYPDGTIYLGSFVDEVYVNLFDRAPDSAGRAYWIDAMYTGSVHFSTFILAAINGAEGNDAVILANKTKYAMDEIRDQLPDNIPSGITWCHDYTLYEVSGHKLIEQKTNPTELREHLMKFGFSKESYPAGTNWIELQGRLSQGDAIIIGEMHSGVICDSDGTICNYFQDGTFHKDPLYQLMDYCYLFQDENGVGRTNCPYINRSIEVWSKTKSVDEAQEADFVGTFTARDPGRTYTEYHGILYFKSDKTFTSKEWANGSLIESQGNWQFDSASTTFTMDWTPGGYFSGPVSGDTNTFTLSGNWSNGSSGTIEFTRQ